MATTIIISLLIGLTTGIFGGILSTGGGAITYSLNSAIDITAATLLTLTFLFTAPFGAHSIHYFRAQHPE
jgi:multisubunit Na+/H+ antiporter MnhG subunit